MKKLVAISIMAAMLLGIGAVAMASETDWLFLLKGGTSGGLVSSSLIQVGTKTGALDGYETTGDTYPSWVAANMNGGSYQPTWTGAPPVYSGDKRAPIGGAASTSATQSWDICFWAGSSYAAGNDLKIFWYNPSGTSDMPTTIGGVKYKYTLRVTADPTGVHTGEQFVLDGNTNSTSTAPWGSLTWTVAQASQLTRAANADGPGAGIHLQFTAAPDVVVTPEPSSLLALASGIFGLAGFSIRRRK